jgi:hypothetical protein
MSFCSTLAPYTPCTPCAIGGITACPCSDSTVAAIQRESGGLLVTADETAIPFATVLQQPSNAFGTPTATQIRINTTGLYRITYTASVSPNTIATTGVTLDLRVLDASSTVQFSNQQSGGPLAILSDNVVLSLVSGWTVSVFAVDVVTQGAFNVAPGAVINIERLG